MRSEWIRRFGTRGLATFSACCFLGAFALLAGCAQQAGTALDQGSTQDTATNQDTAAQGTYISFYNCMVPGQGFTKPLVGPDGKALTADEIAATVASLATEDTTVGDAKATYLQFVHNTFTTGGTTTGQTGSSTGTQTPTASGSTDAKQDPSAALAVDIPIAAAPGASAQGGTPQANNNGGTGGPQNNAPSATTYAQIIEAQQQKIADLMAQLAATQSGDTAADPGGDN